jgi:hypothetical protein
LFGVNPKTPEIVVTNAVVNSTVIKTGTNSSKNGSWLVDILNDAGDSISIYEGKDMLARWKTPSSSLSAAMSAQPAESLENWLLQWSADKDKPHRMVHSVASFEAAKE